MLRTQSSWTSTFARLGFRKARRHDQRRKHRSGHGRRLAAELLEDRSMLSAVGLFERTESHVHAVADVYASAPGDFDDDDDSEIGQVSFAQVMPGPDANASGEDGSADATLSATALLPSSAITSIIHAASESEFHGSAHVDSGLTLPANASGGVDGFSGSGGEAIGVYELIEVPNNAEFRANWVLRSDGFAGGSGDYHLEDTRTQHNLLITELSGNFPLHVWSVTAAPSDIGEWTVTVDLPGEESTTYQYGELYVERSSSWSIDEGTTHVIVQSTTWNFQSANAGGDEGASSSVDWQSSSEVTLMMVDGTLSDDYIPGGLPSLPSSPPKVTNVTLSRPGSTHPAYGFENVVGSGEQLRTVPVGAPNQIAIQFTKEVTLSDSDLELIALNRVVAEPTPDLIQSPNSGNNFTAIWSLSSALPAAQYLLRLPDSIEDLAGNALDGEWTNPASVTTTTATTVFPSGNNVAGGDFEFVFTILPGDANRDNIVDLIDLQIFAANQFGSNKTWQQADFSGDGFVNLPDQQAVYGFYGKNWQNLVILGDYNNDYVWDTVYDGPTFLGHYLNSEIEADLNGDSSVTSADLDAALALLNFGIHLRVLS